ncbi:MAG: hypothetical protein E7287_10530 [Lachnospiraceae bacterium]|nr:hypothetical protein [Lachnospiraceae bacterium]
MTTTVELILAIALLILWGGLGLSLLLSTIQSMIYDKKREKRDQEYHAERMESLKILSNK